MQLCPLFYDTTLNLLIGGHFRFFLFLKLIRLVKYPIYLNCVELNMSEYTFQKREQVRRKKIVFTSLQQRIHKRALDLLSFYIL